MLALQTRLQLLKLTVICDERERRRNEHEKISVAACSALLDEKENVIK